MKTKLTSKRLVLKNSTFSDCENFMKWQSSPDVTKYFTMNDETTYEEVVTDFVLDSNDPTKLLFTIFLKQEDENLPIGRLILTRINRKDDSLDLTRIYIADKSLRNMGIGEEALRLILEYAFINLHMERITVDHVEGNDRAAHLYHKLGFQDEGVMRHSGKKNGKYIDLYLMSMLRSEYYDKIHDN